MKKLSIITINFNNRSGLEKTMKSIFDQKGVDFEYIIIDADSKDGSQDLLKLHAEKITRWKSEPDKGIYDGMNKGIDLATGEYLLFINSGDCLAEPTTLKQAQTKLNSNYDIVYGNLLLNESGVLKKGFMPRKISLSQMMNDTLWHPVSFIKRNLFTRYGKYNTAFKICGDYDFFFRVLIKEKVKTHHIAQFIAVYNLDGLSSDIRNVPLILAERQKAQQSYLSENEIAEFKALEKSKSKGNIFSRWFR